jgi:hypothetical protein
MHGSAVAEVVSDLLALGPLQARPVLSSLVDVLGSRDLDELERLVRDKRKELRRRR